MDTNPAPGEISHGYRLLVWFINCRITIKWSLFEYKSSNEQLDSITKANLQFISSRLAPGFASHHKLCCCVFQFPTKGAFGPTVQLDRYTPTSQISASHLACLYLPYMVLLFSLFVCFFALDQHLFMVYLFHFTKFVHIHRFINFYWSVIYPWKSGRVHYYVLPLLYWTHLLLVDL